MTYTLLDDLQIANDNTTAFLADFGKELQGGLRLSVEDGVAGMNVWSMFTISYTKIIDNTTRFT